MTLDRTRGERAALLTDLADGGRCHVMRGSREVTLLRERGRVYAIETVCPHAGGRLGDGVVHGEEVVCPLHRWRFDLKSGRTKRDSRLRAVAVAIEIDEGEIRWKGP